MSRKKRIEEHLTQEFSPSYMNVEDESHNHHVPKDGETHFKIVLVSTQFSNLPRIERHRLVNHLLHNELAQGLHALSMHLYSPDEWEKPSTSPLQPPKCKDGYKK